MTTRRQGSSDTIGGASSWTLPTRRNSRVSIRLLGWEIGKEDVDYVAISPPDGVTYIAFQESKEYVRPVWPPEQGQQQQMAHLDFEVSDLDAAVAHALELGAGEAGFQPQEGVRVMLDPVGHPFCLYVGD